MGRHSLEQLPFLDAKASGDLLRRIATVGIGIGALAVGASGVLQAESSVSIPPVVVSEAPHTTFSSPDKQPQPTVEKPMAHIGLPLRASLMYQTPVALPTPSAVQSPPPLKTANESHPRFATAGTQISSQERRMRLQIAQVMDNELALNVYETPAGSNRGPRIDYYTDYADNHWKSVDSREWCAAFDSTVFMEAGLPLSGGTPYGKHNPDYLLLRAGKAANPHEKVHITSVLGWFQKNGYFYLNKDHTPRVGDAVFMHYFNSKGKEQWHTGLVRQITPSGTLVTYEGNVGDALRQRIYPNFQNSNYIYGFGSFFQEK